MAELSGAPAFELAEVAGRRILFVLAAHAEYGPELRRRIRPLITGVGPVEAALETGIALGELERQGTLPTLAVSLGSAGSAALEQGRVYQIRSVSWRDMDASALGFAKGVTPFVDHPLDVPLHCPWPDLPAVRLSTGANVVSGAAYRAIDADMVDMETFAVWRACQRFGVPLAGLRGVSDGAAELARFEDWTHLLPILDARLAKAVDELEQALAAAANALR